MWSSKVKRCCGFLAFLFMISYFSPAFAGVIRIPKDEPTIQAAINVASYGDTILVEAGEYVEDIELKTGVQIIGEGYNVTTIRGTGRANVILASNVSDATLAGFKISGSGTGLEGVPDPAGVKVYGGNVIIRNNMITDNRYGIYVYGNSTATIKNNIIRKNDKGFSNVMECGINVIGAMPLIINNLVIENPDDGIYIFREEASGTRVINNTIVGNGLSGIFINNSSPTIKNNIVAGNAGGISAIYDAYPITSNNDVWNIYKNYDSQSGGVAEPGPGDISSDPYFVSGEDFHLASDSPCINTGTYSGAPNADIEGIKRPQGDGYDMGAYEFVSHSNQLSILIDASRDGGAWWCRQSENFNPDEEHQGKKMADYLRSLNYSVTELPRPTTITLDLLNSYDLVIRSNEFGAYTQQEIDDYHEYVKAGGKLLLLSDFMRPYEKDTLALSFGITFRGITRGENYVTKFEPHQITKGVNRLFYFVGSGIAKYPNSANIIGYLSNNTYTDLNNNEVQDPDEPIGEPALGEMTYGSGHIVFYGDTNGLMRVPQPFIDNLLNWFFNSVPTVTYPNGLEVLNKGQDYTITWNSSNVTGNIQIDLYKGGTEQEHMSLQLAAAAENDGEYPFTPPYYLASGDDYFIGISAEECTIWDFSDSSFTIQDLQPFTADPTSGSAPVDITFTCTAYDPDGDIFLTYEWDFDGDGNVDQITSDGTVIHTYNISGTYQAICTVADNDGARVVSDPITITVTGWQTHYSCSQTCEAQCGGNIACMVECNRYQESCCQDGIDICGPQCPLVDPPSVHRVGYCDQGCQAEAPLKVSESELDVCFNYTGSVNILAGVLSDDFMHIWWLGPDCSLDPNYSQAVDSGNGLSCQEISMPVEGGYLFWLVSPVDFSHLDWSKGIYELLFYQVP